MGPLLRGRDGLWSLPDAGLTGMPLGSGTRYGRWWVDLRLGPGGRRHVLLCCDQLSVADWRALQALLRWGRGPRKGLS